MAERSSVDISRKDIAQCGICLETLRQQKLLPCLHSFCRECIQAYIQSQTNKDSFRCPLCKVTIATPDNMSDGLVDNVFLLAEEIKVASLKPPNCHMCEEDAASSTCIECKQHFCEHCARFHSKLTCAKEHHLVSLEPDQKGGKRIQCKVFCSKHPSQELCFFCDACQIVICFKCNMTTHKHHHSKDVEEVAAERRKQVLSIIEDDIEGKAVPDSRSYIDILQKQKMKYEANNTEQGNRIDEHILKIKEHLDKKATDMKQKMNDDLMTRVEILDSELKSTERTLETQEEARQTARRMLELAGDCEWLQRYEEVKSRMTEQLKSKRKIFETTKYVYSPGNISEDAIDRLVGCFDVSYGSTPQKKAFK